MNPETEVKTKLTANGKRSYHSRKTEFLDMTVEQLLDVNNTITDRLKEIDNQKASAMLNDTLNNELIIKKKELTHKRVRLYARLRKLGHNAKELRSQNAKKEVLENASTSN